MARIASVRHHGGRTQAALTKKPVMICTVSTQAQHPDNDEQHTRPVNTSTNTNNTNT